MIEALISRRSLIASLAALAVPAMPGRRAVAQAAPSGEVVPFSEAGLAQQAQDLAKAPFTPPRIALPEGLNALNAEQYDDIRFDPAQAVWASERLAYRMELLHGGYYFRDPVDIAIVEGGLAQRIAYSPSLFTFGPRVAAPPPETQSSFTGFRLLAPLDGPAAPYRPAVEFQGATFFRAMGSGQFAGAAARALVLNYAQGGGEEFAVFRGYWVERPRPGTRDITIHALIDSASTAGTARFSILPGRSTLTEVTLTLYPRVPLGHVGLAPQSSMFLGAPHDASRQLDWRPRVHDSEALSILTGMGEWIFRPLVNPDRLQYSAFADKTPKGFGLVQRTRSFDAYQDDAARYYAKPSLWVEPIGDWGAGAVDLVELPSREETNANVAVFWRPAQPLPEGGPHVFRYRLHWGWEPPAMPPFARVSATRTGQIPRSDKRRFVIDYDGPGACLTCPLTLENIALTASLGEIANVALRPLSETGGQRLTFDYRPVGGEPADLRCVVSLGGKPLAETWVYRWTP